MKNKQKTVLKTAAGSILFLFIYVCIINTVCTDLNGFI